MAGVVVAATQLGDQLSRLVLGLHAPQHAQEAGALDLDLVADLAVMGQDGVALWHAIDPRGPGQLTDGR